MHWVERAIKSGEIRSDLDPARSTPCSYRRLQRSVGTGLAAKRTADS